MLSRASTKMGIRTSLRPPLCTRPAPGAGRLQRHVLGIQLGRTTSTQPQEPIWRLCRMGTMSFAKPRSSTASREDAAHSLDRFAVHRVRRCVVEVSRASCADRIDSLEPLASRTGIGDEHKAYASMEVSIYRKRYFSKRNLQRPRCPRQESNLDLPLRRRSSYPLDYEGLWQQAYPDENACEWSGGPTGTTHRFAPIAHESNAFERRHQTAGCE
jgi:hypothetical protein